MANRIGIGVQLQWNSVQLQWMSFMVMAGLLLGEYKRENSGI